MNEFDKAIEGINDMRERLVETSYYNGSLRTQNKIYEAISKRLFDAEPLIPDEFRTLFQALRNGVLADVKYEGEEVRRNI